MLLSDYRITQEALTNVLRHGHGTSSADVRLRWAEDAVELEVANDGRPARDRIVVDLPEPFGPRKPVTRPGWTVKLKSSTAN